MLQSFGSICKRKIVKSRGKGCFSYQVEKETGLTDGAHLMCCKFRTQTQAGPFVENICTLEF